MGTPVFETGQAFIRFAMDCKPALFPCAENLNRVATWLQPDGRLVSRNSLRNRPRDDASEIRGGERSDYLIHYWAAGFCRKGGSIVRSIDGWREMDLAKPADVKRLTKLLQSLELSAG